MTLKQFLKYYALFLLVAPIFCRIACWLDKPIGNYYSVLVIGLGIALVPLGAYLHEEDKFKPEADDESK